MFVYFSIIFEGMQKCKLFFLGLFVLFMFSSCSSYYQIYTVATAENMRTGGRELVYEDANCAVFYDLWEHGGNIGFQFFNKSEKPIYLNMEESFFILNSVAYNYYKNRVFTNSTASKSTAFRGSSLSRSLTEKYSRITRNVTLVSERSVELSVYSGSSVAFNEEKIIVVPPKSSKFVGEYRIHKSVIKDCDLKSYPRTVEGAKKSFSRSESPLVFSNYLAYSLEKTGELERFENVFYVSEIANYPMRAMIGGKYEEYCGKKGTERVRYFKGYSPNKFYVEY